MSSIERASKIIASKISTNLSLDQDHEEVIRYGAFALIQTSISILLVIIFGVVFNVLLEALVISISAAILRKFSGGVHASSPMGCAVIGMIIFGGLALFVKYFLINIGFINLLVAFILAYVFATYVMIKYSPVGSVNKPLRNLDKRNLLKKQSIHIVLFTIILNIILIAIYLKIKNIYLLNVAICISIGVTWQSITLVSLGRIIIEKLDKLLGGTNI